MVRDWLRNLLISKGFLPIVRDSHELFVVICKGFPSMVRDVLL